MDIEGWARKNPAIAIAGCLMIIAPFVYCAGIGLMQDEGVRRFPAWIAASKGIVLIALISFTAGVLRNAKRMKK